MFSVVAFDELDERISALKKVVGGLQSEVASLGSSLPREDAPVLCRIAADVHRILNDVKRLDADVAELDLVRCVDQRDRGGTRSRFTTHPPDDATSSTKDSARTP